MRKLGYKHSEATKKAISDSHIKRVIAIREGTKSKVCTRCKVDKPITEFMHYKDRSRPVYRVQSLCKPCMNNEWMKWHRKTSPEYKKNRRLGIHFGITLTDYHDMFDKQEGLCATCQKPPNTGRMLVVDHNHISGEVRGLLCATCNSALGMAMEDPKILKGMIEYLEKN